MVGMERCTEDIHGITPRFFPMKRPLLLCVRLALAGSLVACGSVEGLGTGPDFSVNGDVPIRTDSAIYHVRTTADSHELTIGATFTNRSGATAYIPTCRTPHPPVLQKWESEQWVTVYSPPVLECLGPPVVIEAGATYEYAYRVLASRRPNTYPRFETRHIGGLYRLRWHILGSWTPDGPEPNLGVELPLEQRVSNTFTIVG
jgi:hypothetical protein